MRALAAVGPRLGQSGDVIETVWPDQTRQADDHRPRAVDLFSGAGGLTRGLTEAGFAVIAGAEVDPLAAGTYRDNFPDAMVWQGDVRMLSSSRARRDLARCGVRRGQLELLAGCPPCEGFSRMRTRNGGRDVQDHRNDLLLEYIRLVRALLPHCVMLENVPALAGDARFRMLLRQLERLGYEHDGGSVRDVADYGVPQRRRRLVLLAARRRVAELPARPPTVAEPRTVRDAIGHLPPPDPALHADPLHDYHDRRNATVMARIRAVAADGGSRSSWDHSLWLACHADSDGFRDVYGRMRWTAPAPTITGGCINPSKGRFLHPVQDRSITLREAALLQSFPEEHTFRLEGGKYRCAEMIGDAMPPAFVAQNAIGLSAMLAARAELGRMRQLADYGTYLGPPGILRAPR